MVGSGFKFSGICQNLMDLVEFEFTIHLVFAEFARICQEIGKI
jgi:hypothetical protein